MSAAAASVPIVLNVIDPCNRTGKITVPMTVVASTKGVSDFLSYNGHPPADAKDLSLCLLFQKGRCNAGSRCNQVHVAKEYIDDLRARAQAAKSCCARHGDVHSIELESSRAVILHGGDSQRHFQLADFAATPALDIALSRARHGPVRVMEARICRLHARGSCKFGRDCKNIHMCPDAKPRALEQGVDIAPSALLAAPVRTCVVQPEAHRMDVVPAFRPLGITNRACTVDSSMSSTSDADYGVGLGASRGPKQLNYLSIMSGEFNSMRADEDPLDLIDNASTLSSVSASDFDAFVDALCEYDVEPIATPIWVKSAAQ
jgi:hypothetical protein